MKAKQRLTMLIAILLFSLPIMPLQAEEVALTKGSVVNVRGQPSFRGEVVTQLQKGEPVVVLEEISIDKPAQGEPAHWSKIRLPENTPVWVFASFVDQDTQTVIARRLNLRAGPGENFSILGRLEQGAQVREIRIVEDWMEIETPESAHAFVASDLLEKQKAAPVAEAAPEKTVPPPTPPQPVPPTAEKPQVVAPPPPPAPPAVAPTAEPPAEMPVVVPAPSNDREPPSTPVSPANESPAMADHPEMIAPPPAFPEQRKRIVRREGIVRGTLSIQAPTHFELIHPDTRRSINYLNTEYLEDIDLREWRGRRIVVSGEEAIDPRWPRTPVIDVETIQLVF
jgi:SH3-like domain-containing protein